tara:strand:- start:10 stop:390 length:381 start_codon:yes stop_codon:yes gene_type:complete
MRIKDPNATGTAEEQTQSMRDRLEKYWSLISFGPVGPDTRPQTVDPDEMAHMYIWIPSGEAIPAAQVQVVAYVDGHCRCFYFYQDKWLENMFGREESTCTFDDLISYLDQLPKPFQFYCDEVAPHN